MSNKVSRRVFVRTSAFAAMGIGLAACAPAAVPSAPPAATQPPAVAATQPAAAAKAQPAAPAATAQPVVDITIAHFENPAQPIHQDSPSRRVAADATGLKISMVTAPQTEFPAKLKLWVATKQVPDLFRALFS